MATTYTTLSAVASVATTELNSLADDAAAVGAAYDNSAGSPLGRFELTIAAQGVARDSTAKVSLILVPEGASSAYGDITTLKTAGNYVARDVTGKAIEIDLDAAVTARIMTVDGVRVPHGNFKPGLLNETGQAFAATLNTLKMALYGIEDS